MRTALSRRRCRWKDYDGVEPEVLQTPKSARRLRAAICRVATRRRIRRCASFAPRAHTSLSTEKCGTRRGTRRLTTRSPIRLVQPFVHPLKHRCKQALRARVDTPRGFLARPIRSTFVHSLNPSIHLSKISRDVRAHLCPRTKQVGQSGLCEQFVNRSGREIRIAAQGWL